MDAKVAEICATATRIDQGDALAARRSGAEIVVRAARPSTRRWQLFPSISLQLAPRSAKKHRCSECFGGIELQRRRIKSANNVMREEIRQFGEVLLWAEGEEHTSVPMIFRNMTGRNFSGKEYHDYIRGLVLDSGFEVGRVELWCDGTLVDCGNITLRGHE